MSPSSEYEPQTSLTPTQRVNEVATKKAEWLDGFYRTNNAFWNRYFSKEQKQTIGMDHLQEAEYIRAKHAEIQEKIEDGHRKAIRSSRNKILISLAVILAVTALIILMPLIVTAVAPIFLGGAAVSAATAAVISAATYATGTALIIGSSAYLARQAVTVMPEHLSRDAQVMTKQEYEYRNQMEHLKERFNVLALQMCGQSIEDRETLPHLDIKNFDKGKIQYQNYDPNSKSANSFPLEQSSGLSIADDQHSPNYDDISYHSFTDDDKTSLSSFGSTGTDTTQLGESSFQRTGDGASIRSEHANASGFSTPPTANDLTGMYNSGNASPEDVTLQVNTDDAQQQTRWRNTVQRRASNAQDASQQNAPKQWSNQHPSEQSAEGTPSHVTQYQQQSKQDNAKGGNVPGI